MPVHCERKGESWRICGPDGKIEKTPEGNPRDGGGHPTEEDCQAQARAMNGKMTAQPPVFVLRRWVLAEMEPEPNGKPCEIIYLGTFHLADRNRVLEITREHLEQMVKNFHDLDGPDRIAFNINHNSGASTLDEARAVGWLQDLFIREQDGRVSLMGRPRWCEDARERLAAEQFKYLSAEIDFNATDSATGEKRGCRLAGVAICNCPAIPDLAPIELTVFGDKATKIEWSITRLEHLAQGSSLLEKVERLIQAFFQAYPDSNVERYYPEDVRENCLIIRVIPADESPSTLFQVNYQLIDGKATFTARDRWIEVEPQYVPLAASLAQLKAVEVHKPPVAESDSAWDSAAAVRHLRAWAGGEKLDPAKYRQGFAWYDESAPENLGSYKLPHHDIMEGRLVTVRRGVMAAGNALQGGRGGVDLPQGERTAVEAHMAVHYRQCDMEPPWMAGRMAGKTLTANTEESRGEIKPSAAKSGTQQQEDRQMDELRKLLGIGAEISLEEAIVALVAKADQSAALIQEKVALEAQLATLIERVKEAEALQQEKVAAQTALTTKQGEIETLSTQATAYKGEMEKLSTQVKGLLAAQHERETQDRIELNLRRGRLTPAELEAESGYLRKLANEQPGVFDSVMATRPERPELFRELGSNTTAPNPSVEEIFTLRNQEINEARKNGEVIEESEALRRVFAKRPDLEKLQYEGGR